LIKNNFHRITEPRYCTYPKSYSFATTWMRLDRQQYPMGHTVPFTHRECIWIGLQTCSIDFKFHLYRENFASSWLYIHLQSITTYCLR